MIRVLGAILGSACAVCLAAAQEFGEAGNGPHEAVPLATLIVDGERFDGKQVWVAGVLRVEFEGDSLYLTKEHYSHRVAANAIWLSFDQSRLGATRDELAKFNGRYVYLSGVFSHENRGHFGVYQGAIREVGHIRILPQPD